MSNPTQLHPSTQVTRLHFFHIISLDNMRHDILHDETPCETVFYASCFQFYVVERKRVSQELTLRSGNTTTHTEEEKFETNRVEKTYPSSCRDELV